ncbi:hypothetical protein B0H16DRAFT_1725099 [Mycena metata]|uniref:Uncharacterized protein n=1 Tax=Mycena metata TaxID=1033252 RepID=A0AAD7N887_9AGAR|nr:hypothetical protein B0H16DRAFT_1725099 [Mycena metata]
MTKRGGALLSETSEDPSGPLSRFTYFIFLVAKTPTEPDPSSESNFELSNANFDEDAYVYNPNAADARSADSSIKITPPLAPRPSSKKQTAPVTSESEDDVDSPKKPKPKKKKAVETKVVDPADRKLILMVPRAESQGTQRVQLTHATSFDDTLVVIHETIGCTDPVIIKPVLMYKLSSTAAKVNPISLDADGDWEGCLDEVTAEKKKPVSVQIIVTEQYLLSLRARLKIKTAPKGKGKGKDKMVILDLEHAGSGDDDFDEGLGIMEKERTFLAQLQTKYGRCQLCGPDKACKIDVTGSHCKLSNSQLRAWAHSLAVETRGVTDSTPPNDGLFGMFFKNSKSLPAAAASIPRGSPCLRDAAAVTPGTPTPQPPSRASGSKLEPAFPSSDPPEMGAINPYPEIVDFLHELDGYQPRRNLLNCILLFEELDFYNIDEIAKLKTPQQLTTVVQLSLGNATYIMEPVKAEMKRVDRARALSA